MPELPDLTVYLEHLNERIRGEVLSGIRIVSPFVLRTVTPTVEEICGRKVLGCSRLAKQLVIELESEHYLVIHLMISGRLQWRQAGTPVPKRNGLAGFDFTSGTMIFTEASKKKRASLRLVQGVAQLAELDPGGLEVSRLDADEFAVRLHGTKHTLKRALTDQHVFAGIGNAYSDEILLQAKLSPFKQARTLSDEECKRLYDAARSVLDTWTDLLREKAGGEFPRKVTAFHEEMAVHGKYKKPCPVCGSPVQRIVYAQNEANYCARCQTGGRLLSDRSLARLLKDSWPKRIEDLE
ncbi:MAG: formamidopyrimidine-DNA glycosylase [Gammaproteobacteria bacterium]|nr:formamidopyrimidine-DNA glycosylase [Gammaproteobacteria bacterium]